MANAVDDRTYGIHVDHVRSRQRRRLPDRREHGSSCRSIPDVSTDDRVAAAPGFTGVQADPLVPGGTYVLCLRLAVDSGAVSGETNKATFTFQAGPV
ncbi:MAG: hypothetical protein L0H03_09305 [Rhodococcus sp. (in: high G+C Gram-positive bacteria)]|nr:hypothetical protein [Rhodococcus sp. (in: high G+C Gram-positive bacteria)]